MIDPCTGTKHSYLHNRAWYVLCAHTIMNVFTMHTSKCEVDANLKNLKILTKVVIELDFSKVLLTAHVYTAKTPVLRENWWKMVKCCQYQRPIALFGATCTRKWQIFIVFTLWSCDTMYLKIDLINRWYLKRNFAESNTKKELLRNFTNGSLRSHDLYVRPLL